VAAECRRSWNRILGRPAPFSSGIIELLRSSAGFKASPNEFVKTRSDSAAEKTDSIFFPGIASRLSRGELLPFPVWQLINLACHLNSPCDSTPSVSSPRQVWDGRKAYSCPAYLLATDWEEVARDVGATLPASPTALPIGTWFAKIWSALLAVHRQDSSEAEVSIPS